MNESDSFEDYSQKPNESQNQEGQKEVERLKQKLAEVMENQKNSAAGMPPQTPKVEIILPDKKKQFSL